MKVEFSFKHVDQSDALMDYACERMEKLTRFELKPMDVLFTISMESRHECRIDVIVLEGRRKFKAEAMSDDFYRSVEMVINKLSRQLSKDKGRVKNHKNPDRSNYGKIARLNDQLEIDYTLEKPLRKVG
jgi:putative sigma-54 modulation protein